MDDTDEPEPIEPVEENEDNDEDSDSIITDDADDDEMEEIIAAHVEPDNDEANEEDYEIQKDGIDKDYAEELNNQGTAYKNTFIFDNDLEANDSEEFLQKFGDRMKNDFIATNHQECLSKNMDEIKEFLHVIRDKDNIIIDNLHRTVAILSKYEKTRIIGVRLKQLNNGAEPYINVSEDIIDNNYIAEKELKLKKIPFIIQRPIANNTFEYWRLEDLEIL